MKRDMKHMLGPLPLVVGRFRPKFSFECELPAGDYLIGDILLIRSSSFRYNQFVGCFEEKTMPGAFYAQADAVSGDGTYIDSLGRNNVITLGMLGIIDARLVRDRNQSCMIHANHHSLFPAHAFEKRHHFDAPVRIMYEAGVFTVTCLEFVLTIDTTRTTH